jgi:phage tail P2-like protein
MRIDELDLMEFFPQYMRQDKTTQGMAYAITQVLKNAVISNIEKCNIYSRIGQLEESMLDELAWQFNIPEYISTLELPQKRAIIRNCMTIHRQRGTVAAVENVIASVFGNGYVEEWFDYDKNKPYHFKVHTTNASTTDDMIAEFEKVVESTQNVRSVLEAVIIETSLEMSSFQGVYTHTAEIVYI